MAEKCPKIAQKLHKIAHNSPKITQNCQNGPKITQNGPKIYLQYLQLFPSLVHSFVTISKCEATNQMVKILQELQYCNIMASAVLQHCVQ